MITIVLLAFALLAFVLSAFWTPAPDSRPRVNLIAAGLAFWLLAELISHTGMSK